MYATAQRVQSKQATGINVFRYIHGSTLPIDTDGYPDLVTIETSSPGYLVDSDLEVPPGGNDVLSYLAVAAADDVMPAIIEGRLRAIEDQVSSVSLPHSWRSGALPVVVRFGGLGLEGAPARSEFTTLLARLTAQLAKRIGAVATEPFRFRLSRAHDQYTLTVEPASRARLVAEGLAPAARSISASFDVVTARPAHLGPLLPYAIAALMNRDLHDLLRRGGVVVLDEDNQVIWERLPPR